MPAAARYADPITHSEAHSEGITQMLEGIGTGLLIGVALIGVTVLTGGTDLLVIGAAVAAGGTVLSMGGKGFLQGVSAGQKKVEVHGQVETGSLNVTINKRKAAAACLSEIKCDEHSGPQKMAEGSRTVTLNGKMASRVGDHSTCDAVIGSGSGNVTIGGATGQCAAISKEVADWETELAQGAIIAGTVLQIVGTIVSGVGAIRLITLAPAALRAMMMVRLGAGLVGGTGLGSVGHYFAGKKYGEGSWQQEGVTAGFGLLGGYLGDAAASSGPRLIGGIKSGFEGLTEPVSSDGGEGGAASEAGASKTPQEVSQENYDRAVQAKSDLSSKLDPNGVKTVASAGDKDYLSGWQGKQPRDLPESYNSVTPEDVKAHADEIGHSLTNGYANDQINNGGFEGKYFASHAEKQALLGSNGESPGVSQDMCPDCQGFFRQDAIYNGRTNYNTDPNGQWQFQPDGVVIRPDGETILPTDTINRNGSVTRQDGTVLPPIPPSWK